MALLFCLQCIWSWVLLAGQQAHLQSASRLLASILSAQASSSGSDRELEQWLVRRSGGWDGAELKLHQSSASIHRGDLWGLRARSPLVDRGQSLGTLTLFRNRIPEMAWCLASWVALLVLGWRWRRAEDPATACRSFNRCPAKVEGSPGAELVEARDTAAWEKLHRRLRELRDLYCSVCDNAHDLILVCQTDGTLVFANKTTLKHCPTLEPGTPIWKLFDQPSKDVASDFLIESLTRGRVENFRATLLTDAGVLPVEGSFCPGMVESGEMVTVLAIFRDLSQQIYAEEQLRQAQKMEAVGRLAGGVAHDFNNLLTVMGSVSALIRAEPEDSPQRWDSLDLLDQVVDRASELTRQLLVFSRRSPRQCSTLSVDRTLSDFLRLAGRLLGEDINLVHELRSNAWILADRCEFEQVCMNLVVNARDAMPGGGRLTVTTVSSSWRGNSAVCLSVTDQGCGMSGEVARRIFEPYFTTKEVGRGTGLGLSTVYAIIDQLGGSIEVDSELGKGTTFRVHLPTCPPPTGEVTTTARLEQSPGKGSILLVEDEALLCKATSRTLTHLGYSVVSYQTPKEALDWLRGNQPPDLVVSDLIMPGMTGVEMMREARRVYPGLKALYVSGYPGDSLDHAEDADIAWLQKPFRHEELHRRIRQLLDAQA